MANGEACGDHREGANPFVRGVERSNLYVWGWNVHGQTSHAHGFHGDPRTWQCQRLPQPIEEQQFIGRHSRAVPLVDVACGLQHTAAVGSDGSLFTWGSNNYGQLGDGFELDTRSPTRVPALDDEVVTSVACGSHFTAVITNQRPPGDKATNSTGEFSSGVPVAGRLWVWGHNQRSNLPRLLRGAFPPNTVSLLWLPLCLFAYRIMGQVVKQVACGANHAAAVSSSGQLQTWGYNEVGQLGWGFVCEGLQEPRVVSAFVFHLDDPAVAVRVEKVGCGEYHCAAIASETEELYTWGLGASGQLGHRSLQGRRRYEALPRKVVALEWTRVKAVACGRAHTTAVSCRGGLYIWGGGREGQLGIGRRESGSIGLGGNFWEGAVQNTPILVLPRGVRDVACGQDHTLATGIEGRIIGWGYNSCGQAATGRESYAWLPTPIDWCVGGVVKVAAGGGHSAVLTQATCLKELCEFHLAESVDLKSVPHIAEVAVRHGSEALARFCKQYERRMLSGVDLDLEQDEDRRRRSRNISRPQ